MKQVIAVVAVAAILMSCSSSRVQSSDPYERNGGYGNNRVQLSFDFYPAANVYYDRGRSCYIYHDGRSWVSARSLPRNIYLNNSPRYQVYSQTPDIWRYNDQHRRTYYTAPQPQYQDRGRNDRDDDHRDRDRRHGRHSY